MVEEVKAFKIGIEGLDKILGEITPPYTILVAGHPGSGKTTFAASICYSNTVRGGKCLYITFYEEKEKFYMFMEKLGLKLREAEKKNLLKFVRLPVSSDVEKVLEAISEIISKEKFNVVVIDSITPLIEALETSIDKRAILLNYFYQLSSTINGLLILLAELPYGKQTLEMGSPEFVADAILVLKSGLENGFLTRLIEIRKARGKPIYLAEIPFTITNDKGVVVYTPPILEEIPKQKEEIYFPCRVYNEKIGHMHKDFTINIFYPPEALQGRAEAFIIILAQAVTYNLRVLIVSYVLSPAIFKDMIISTLNRYGISEKIAEEIINRYVIIKGINPYAQSLAELKAKELELVEQYKPDIVVFHGVHIIKHQDYEKYFRELYNEILYLKHKGISTIRIGNCVNMNKCLEDASIADLMFVMENIIKDTKYDYVLKAFRRYRTPVIIESHEVRQCVEEAIEKIRSFSL
ncbi:ATPase domain-containing protein [Ignisphaera sp. 4213-co]|uniref:ATPase domain-containing protein n=1 Tax=Ignisphaera cupida TaxID=3050454 RepID=A0ABD4Z4J5_9CREN|nr:ATPase domain-containing protein [Ignisphaera sp. 4213-co]MDK6028124.1 ATPase domain-containing protein [Ignisphaera sp. 4213-co]